MALLQETPSLWNVFLQQRQSLNGADVGIHKGLALRARQ
jgi:hypothetical protein